MVLAVVCSGLDEVASKRVRKAAVFGRISRLGLEKMKERCTDIRIIYIKYNNEQKGSKKKK